MRAAAIVLVGLVAGVAVASGQAQRQPASLDDVVNEIRALRADLKESTRTSAQMQLLTARLQAQEQRIGILATQRAGIVPRLIEASRLRMDAEGRLQSVEQDVARNLPAEQTREQREATLNAFKLDLAHVRDVEQQLRAEDDRLSAEIANEQNRWQDFNSRLDEIERSLK